MGESELKAALQREGAVQIADLWRQAEATVATRRKEIEAERLQLRTETDRKVQTQATVLRNNVLFEAQTRAMGDRLHEEEALAERLRLLAQQMLPELASNDRARLWQALRAELPATAWSQLTVHPADHKQASRDFPGAEITADEALGGGLIATNPEATIRIDNSLRCRLMRAWPDLLPKLLRELRKQVNCDETARTDTTG